MANDMTLAKNWTEPLDYTEAFSDDYTVTVNGSPVPVRLCRVSSYPLNRVWPGKQRDVEQTHLASFTRFDLTAPAEIVVRAAHPFREAKLRPSGIVPITVDGDTVRFTLTAPGQFSLELDGRRANLHIFADAPQAYDFDPAACTHYFGPGVHEAGLIELHSGETLFIDADAIVYGTVRARNAEHIGIYGRGILDYSRYERHDPLIWEEDGLLNFVACRDVTVEGITLRDSSWWNMTAFNCVGMEFRFVKVIGAWRYNTDGFDFVNSQQIHVDSCFLRAFDDVIVLKGLCVKEDRVYEKMDVADVLVENCVLWCDWGGALEIGAETVADEYRNITYRNTRILCNTHGALRIHAGDRADIHNVTYEDITVEYTPYERAPVYQDTDETPYAPADVPVLPEAIRAWMYCGVWSPDNIPGHVHNVRYKNIALLTDPGVADAATLRTNRWVQFLGADAEHRVSDVVIENLTVNGERLDRRVMDVNEFTNDINI